VNKKERGWGMPRIKRWYPVSHDLNRDPEFCELVERFGAPGIRCWLELLSIADRNDGEVPGDYISICKPLAGVINTKSNRVLKILYWFNSKQWIQNQSPIRVCNYSKYHVTRDANKIPQGNSSASPPSLPILPNQNKEDIAIAIATAESASLSKNGDQKIAPSFTAEHLLAFYNELTPEGFFVATDLENGRREKAVRALALFPEQSYWEAVFAAAHHAPLLCGLVPPSNGHSKAFHASFDWLLSPGKDGSYNFTKVHDGYYAKKFAQRT
jgi:hypothetical protein